MILAQAEILILLRRSTFLLLQNSKVIFLHLVRVWEETTPLNQKKEHVMYYSQP
jgi:hypothetical protein